MTQSNKETRELSTEDLHLVSGGEFKLPTIRVDYSKGCGCIDVSIGGFGIWIGRAGLGWSYGDQWGRL